MVLPKFDSHFKLTEKDIIPYVKETLDIFSKDANLKAEEIGDGNINYVFRVWDEDTKKIHCNKTSGHSIKVFR